jgi:glycosyltransferase involved in cell wall biosynthesis
MKILMVTPYFPYPLVSGGQIRTYNLLKKLAPHHKITLVSYYREDKEKEYLPELEKYCDEVVMIKRRPAWSLLNILFAGVTPYPFLVSTYLSATARRRMAGLLENKDFDLIHIETFYLMPMLPKTNIPILLVEQTIEYQVYKNFVRDFKFWPIKPLLLFDVWKIKRWEEFYWRKATRLAAVSQDDKKIMAETVAADKLEVIANGIDKDFFFSVERNVKEPTVFFVGNFKWLPNREAVIHLVKDIWPKIKQQVDNARLLIVGRNVSDEIAAFRKKQGIEIKEDVEDIRAAFAQASVLLAPIRNGRGTKYKVLEAMACGVPVVTTPLGIEGIDAEEGKEVFVRREDGRLAEQAVKLLKDENLNSRMGKAGRRLVRKAYNWEEITAHLDQVYKEMK